MSCPQTKRGGFTLVELLIVVVILGVLATIAIPRFTETRFRAFRSTVISDLKALASQQEIHHMAHFTYTSTLADMEYVTSEGVTVTVNVADGTGWSAQAEHTGVPGESCGIFYGTAPAAGGAPATIPGVVACSF